MARQGSRDCTELADVLADWDGKFSPLWRKRIARHVDECAECEKKRAVLLAPGGAVLAAPFLLAPSTIRERVLASAARGAVVQPSAAPRGRLFSNKKVAVGSAAAVVLVVGAVLTVGANRTVAPSVEVLPVESVAVTVDSTIVSVADTTTTIAATPTTESPVTNVTRKPATTVVNTQPPRTTVAATAPVVAPVTTTAPASSAPVNSTASGIAQQAQVPVTSTTTTLATAPAVKVTLPTVNTKPVFVTTTVATNAPPVITQYSCKWDGKGYFVMLDVVDPNGDAILKNSVRESNSNPVFAVDASKTGSTSRYFGTVVTTSPKVTVTYYAKDTKGAQGSLTRVLSSSACA